MENLQGGSTFEYAVEISHAYNEGLVVLPVAGPLGTPASVVRINAPIEYRSIAWSAARLGGAPRVPSWKAFINPSNNNLNLIFLGGQRTADIPTPTGNSQQRWIIIAGQYTYGLVNPEGLDSVFQLGKMPWETGDTSINDIPPDFFDPIGILSARPKILSLPPYLLGAQG